MKHRSLVGSFAACMIVLLLIACGTGPDATSIALMPTDSPTVAPSATGCATLLASTSTATATATATLTPVATPTPTPVLSPTRTQTETPTATTTTPTETPLPVFSFQPDFDEVHPSVVPGVFAEIYQLGYTYAGEERVNEYSYYGLIDDPTGSGRGVVYQGVVSGGPPPVAPETQDGHRHRPHVDKHLLPGEPFEQPWIDGPWAVEVDIWVDTPEKLLISPPNDTDRWFSPLGCGDTGEKGRNGIPPWHFTATTHLGIDPRATDDSPRLVALINPDDSGINWMGTMSPIPFPMKQWVNIRLEVLSDRTVRLLQDGQVISTHRLGPKSIVGIAGCHAGLYAGADVRNLVVLNDDFSINVFEE